MSFSNHPLTFMFKLLLVHFKDCYGFALKLTWSNILVLNELLAKRMFNYFSACLVKSN